MSIFALAGTDVVSATEDLAQGHTPLNPETFAVKSLAAIFQVAEAAVSNQIGQDFKPLVEFNIANIPQLWQGVIDVYNANFNAPVIVAEVPKKKRKRNVVMSPNLGWPMGVNRAEYKEWKEKQIANGVTEGLNPQTYKRIKEEIASRSGAEFDDQDRNTSSTATDVVSVIDEDANTDIETDKVESKSKSKK